MKELDKPAVEAIQYLRLSISVTDTQKQRAVSVLCERLEELIENTERLNTASALQSISCMAMGEHAREVRAEGYNAGLANVEKIRIRWRRECDALRIALFEAADRLDARRHKFGAEQARLAAGFNPSKVPQPDQEECRPMNEEMQDPDSATTAPMSTTGLPPAPIPEWQARQFRRLLDRLSEWRSDDHEDAIVLCRSEIIAILDGVKSVQNRLIGEASGLTGDR